MAATPAPEEIELKLVAPDVTVLAEVPRVLQQLGFEVGPDAVHEVRDTYYDTEDWRHHRDGFALRLREKRRPGAEHPSRTLTRKALAAAEEGVAVREEIERRLEDGEEAPLEGMRPLFEVHQWRQVRPVSGPNDFTAELSCDRVEWRTDRGDDTGYEIEIELRTGPRTTLHDLGAALQARTACRAESTSKFERGLRIAGLDRNVTP